MQEKEREGLPIEEIKEEYPQDSIHPITPPFRAYLHNEIQKVTPVDPLVVISQIEEISHKGYHNPREYLYMSLEPLLQENTRLFISKLMNYKKKPCRDGPNCKRGPSCYFIHEHESYAPLPSVIKEPESLRSLFEKQKRLFESLERKPLPMDLKSTIERLRKSCIQVRGLVINKMRQGTNDQDTRPKAFQITNRKEWMTDEHLRSYPGVLSISNDGVVECETRKDAERVMNMIKRGDYSVETMWV